MAVRRFDKMVLDGLAQVFQRLDHLLGLVRRIEPVRREGEELYGCRDRRECLMEGFAPPGYVVKVERFGQVEEGIRIEAVDEVIAVV